MPPTRDFELVRVGKHNHSPKVRGLEYPLRKILNLCECNGPGVVQRKDRQKKEFHDQSDYR